MISLSRDIPDVIGLSGTKAQHLSMAVRVLGASPKLAKFGRWFFETYGYPMEIGISWDLTSKNGDFMGLNQQKR